MFPEQPKLPLGVNRIMLRGPGYNIGLAARVKGSIDSGRFKHAVNRLSEKHPFLRARVELDDRGYGWFVFDRSKEVPVHIQTRTREKQWQDAIIAENTIPFDLENGPLVRFILLNSASEEDPVNDIIIYAQHSISDGLSVCYLLRDLLILLADPDAPMPEYAVPPSYSFANIAGSTWKKIPFKMIAVPLNLIWAGKKKRFPLSAQKDLQQAFARQELAVHTWLVQGRDFLALTRSCKQRGVTVNSAVCAALLKARHAVQGSDVPYPADYILPVNIRQRLIPPVQEEMGFYTSSISGRVPGIEAMTHAQVAEYIDAQVKKNLQTNGFISTPLLTNLHPTLLDTMIFARYGLCRDRFVHWVMKFLKWDKRAADFEISNFGRLDFLPRSWKDVTISHLAIAIHMPLIEKFICITTIDDVMTFTCTYNLQDVSSETIQHMGQETVRLLQEFSAASGRRAPVC